ncbi:hypothetical protein [Amycolatopsis pigmentata]|uniref:Uncharacterized protein n=1 Tax=Amycolatopsis pigmentata TaxID=450801 RepID=A0ABW5FKC9_9PSEU
MPAGGVVGRGGAQIPQQQLDQSGFDVQSHASGREQDCLAQFGAAVNHGESAQFGWSYGYLT